jgi:hypothetical protein
MVQSHLFATAMVLLQIAENFQNFLFPACETTEFQETPFAETRGETI